MSHITIWVFPMPCSHGKLHPMFACFAPKMPQTSSEIALIGFQYFPDFFCQIYRRFKGLNDVFQEFFTRQLKMVPILDAP
jgi:hypothetical protein